MDQTLRGRVLGNHVNTFSPLLNCDWLTKRLFIQTADEFGNRNKPIKPLQQLTLYRNLSPIIVTYAACQHS